jgi:hypothetical protein
LKNNWIPDEIFYPDDANDVADAVNKNTTGIRPINLGGTGGATIAEARANLRMPYRSLADLGLTENANIIMDIYNTIPHNGILTYFTNVGMPIYPTSNGMLLVVNYGIRQRTTFYYTHASQTAGQVRFWFGSVVNDTWSGWYEAALASTVAALPTQESGTWTPQLRGGTVAGSPTYSSRAGTYIRVGNIVTVSGTLVLSSKGGMSGEISLFNLPFAGTRMPFVSGMNMGLNGVASISGSARNYSVAAGVTLMKSVTGGHTALLDTDITDSLALYEFGLTYQI